MNYTINHSEENFRDAINYDGTDYYNCPMSITIDDKLFIIPCGTSDDITVKIEGNLLYLVYENSGLDYAGLTVINTDTNDVETCFLSGDDLTNEENISYKLLEKDTEEQIKILAEYLPY